jgi:hypothetical protein
MSRKVAEPSTSTRALWATSRWPAASRYTGSARVRSLPSREATFRSRRRRVDPENARNRPDHSSSPPVSGPGLSSAWAVRRRAGTVSQYAGFIGRNGRAGHSSASVCQIADAALRNRHGRSQDAVGRRAHHVSASVQSHLSGLGRCPPLLRKRMAPRRAGRSSRCPRRSPMRRISRRAPSGYQLPLPSRRVASGCGSCSYCARNAPRSRPSSGPRRSLA